MIFLWKSVYFPTYNSRLSEKFNLLAYAGSMSLSTGALFLCAKRNRFLSSFWCTAWVDYLSMLLTSYLFSRNIIYEALHYLENELCVWQYGTSLSLFLVSTLPLLPSHAVIKNNLVFLKLLCSCFFPVIPEKELL